MANVVEACNGETNPCVTMQLPGFPRDLLQNSVPGTKFHRKFVDTSEDEVELELSLGLSLNGRFGLDPARENKLIWSSSIPKLVKPLTENAMACTPMPTACSLPMETHDECRKRKEMQSLRRMEAKRKRTEKQRNMKAVNYLNKFEEEREALHGSVRNHKIDQVSKRGGDSHVMSDLGGRIKGAELKSDNENRLFCSQGSGSSGISEFDGQQIQGGSRCAEVRSPVTVQSQPDNEQRSPPNMQGDSNQSSTFAVRNALESLRNSSTEANGLVNNILVDMPCVSTKGDGTDGKKIEGFLYRYRKGEEVKIVCVCHGRFLSPAEFVKHAGGGDVSNPLKHIVVNPAPFL